MLKVTIIVPFFNAEKSLNRCLDSLVHQTYENIEILLINDGSTDESENICRSFMNNYSNIQMITQVNSGPATARNNGIDHAVGDYISFVDADDYIESDYISSMIEVAKTSEADMVICAYFEENGTISKVHSYNYSTGIYEGNDVKDIGISLISDVSDHRIPPYSWIRMVKRDVFNSPRIRYDDGMIRSEDYFLYTQLHFRLQRLYILDKPLYHYVENKSSVTHTYVEHYWAAVKKIYDGLECKLPSENMVREKLDIMLIQRSMVALNNASRSDKGEQIKAEISEIIKDQQLKLAIKRFRIFDGLKLFGPFFILMRLKLYRLVFLRYFIKSRE